MSVLQTSTVSKYFFLSDDRKWAYQSVTQAPQCFIVIFRHARQRGFFQLSTLPTLFACSGSYPEVIQELPGSYPAYCLTKKTELWDGLGWKKVELCGTARLA